ncbi:Uncharacterised protein [Streptococcus pneumoniae]|nr:Uncharacterised protein [Streptococcus pneumoniae]
MSTCNLKLLFKDEIPWEAQGLTKSNTRLQSLRKRMKLKSDGVMGSE